MHRGRKQACLETGGRASSVLGVRVTASGVQAGETASLLSQLLSRLPRLEPHVPSPATDDSEGFCCSCALAVETWPCAAEAAVLAPSALPDPSPAAAAGVSPVLSLGGAAAPAAAKRSWLAAAAVLVLLVSAVGGAPPTLTLYFLERGRAVSAPSGTCPPALAVKPTGPIAKASGDAAIAASPGSAGNRNWLLDACLHRQRPTSQGRQQKPA